MDAIKTTEIKFAPGPGQRLKAAREAYKLSIDYVAQHLRLERKLILELEADRYENMPHFTFIRGYLRSYARLVDLPPDELILCFDNLPLAEKPVRTMEQTFVVKDYSSFKNYWSARWTRYVLLGAIVLFALLAYQSVTKIDLYTNLINSMRIF